jgi:hypothetical protein
MMMEYVFNIFDARRCPMVDASLHIKDVSLLCELFNEFVLEVGN